MNVLVSTYVNIKLDEAIECMRMKARWSSEWVTQKRICFMFFFLSWLHYSAQQYLEVPLLAFILIDLPKNDETDDRSQCQFEWVGIKREL